MLDTLIILLALLVSPDDADALRRTAPSYLTVETARVHLAAARLAAAQFSVDPDLVLSIAYYESRYNANERTQEPRRKISCGVMTPVPKYACETPSLAAGYLEGAGHLREWLDMCRGHELCALRGYAGGWSVIRICGDATARAVSVCRRVEARQWRAGWIRRLRAAYAAS